jgi:hypothetical protein
VRVAIAFITLVGCGRVGFDPRADGGLPGDGTSTFVISATQLTTGFPAYVNVAVDWDRNLAYASSREPGRCLDVVDFTAAPTVVKRIAPPDTSGDLCTGVSLDPVTHTHLVLTSISANTAEYWDLGADPRQLQYVRETTLGVHDPRRVVRRFDDPTTLLVAIGNAPAGFEIINETPSSPWLAVARQFSSTLACPDQLDEVVETASNVVLTPCSTNDSPVEVVDDPSMIAIGTIPAPLAGESGFSTTATTSAGSLAVAMGWVSVVLDTTSRYTMRARFDNDSAYRAAEFIDRGRGHELVALRASDAVDIFSLVDPSQPVITHSGTLGVGPELYGLAIAPDQRHAAVVSNHGWFLLVDLDQLPAANITWPAF